jgi:hypothetical protein
MCERLLKSNQRNGMQALPRPQARTAHHSSCYATNEVQEKALSSCGQHMPASKLCNLLKDMHKVEPLIAQLTSHGNSEAEVHSVLACALTAAHPARVPHTNCRPHSVMMP